jgi:protein-S-isoprenylcysteine O-methyltransferase Ste14
MITSIRHFIGYNRILFSGAVVFLLLILAKPTVLTILLGLPFIVGGAGIRIWSSGYIDKNKALIMDGPYALIRHPLYMGNFVIGLGFAIMAGEFSLLLVFLCAFGIIYLSTIMEEEKYLQELYGQQFSEYVREVPRFIPRLAGKNKDHMTFEWRRVRGHKEYKAWAAIGVCVIFMVFKSYYIA